MPKPSQQLLFSAAASVIAMAALAISSMGGEGALSAAPSPVALSVSVGLPELPVLPILLPR